MTADHAAIRADLDEAEKAWGLPSTEDTVGEQTTIRTLVDDARALLAENEALRAEIDYAPHTRYRRSNSGYEFNPPCDCWKSRVPSEVTP